MTARICKVTQCPGWFLLFFSISLAEVYSVGHVSENAITNTGSEIWKQEAGLLSIWSLGIYKPSLETAVVLPIKAAKVVSLASLLDEMVDREAVARWPHPEFTLKQASSYERDSKTPDDADGWFANHDWSWFLRSEENNGRNEWVLMDVEGPGAIVRMWAASQRPVGNEPKGRLRFYIDGANEPEIEGTLHELLSGRSFIKPPISMANLREEDHLWEGNNLWFKTT